MGILGRYETDIRGVIKGVRQLLLCSGGLDSVAVGLVWGADAVVFVDYGQPCAREERVGARRLAKTIGAPFHTITIRPSPYDEQMVRGWMPARNGLLLRVAAPIALREECQAIVFGFVYDQQQFPDTTAEWLVYTTYELAASGVPIVVAAPALFLSRHQLLKNVPPHHLNLLLSTHSCFYPQPCGKCPKCRERHRALKRVKLEQ